MVNVNDENVLMEGDEEDFDFASMFESTLKIIRVGHRISGIVTSINGNEIQVDLGAKQSGYIPVAEFSEDSSEMVKIGDEIDAFVMKVSDAEGTVLLSKKKLDSVKGFEKIENAYRSNATIKGKVLEAVKGGMVVLSQGARVFIPFSQTGLKKEDNLETLVNTEVTFKIIEVDIAENSRRRRIIGSIKAVNKAQRDKMETEIWESIEIGKQYEGVVKSIVTFGAFVDIGGVDGLVHISDLSWNKIKHPSEIVKLGDVLNVVIKNFDKDERKISLTYKDLSQNPWNSFVEQYHVDDVVNVEVQKIMAYGAFVRIIPGIDGLIHISQISDKRIIKVGDALSVGQTIDAKITEIDMEKQKINLSIKALIIPDENDSENVEVVEEIVEVSDKIAE